MHEDAAGTGGVGGGFAEWRCDRGAGVGTEDVGVGGVERWRREEWKGCEIEQEGSGGLGGWRGCVRGI